jgi:chromosome partitioning protein
MILAICNQKGGVGKTTLATNLAVRMKGPTGKPNLLVDCDPQGNATTTLGVEIKPGDFTLNDVLAAVATGSAGSVARGAILNIKESWSLDLLPADRLLASRESDTSLGRETRLATVTEELREDYGHIIIDCPPAIGMLTTNALVAADKALIVTQARETSVDGVSEMVSTIATIRSHYNPRLTLAGIVLNAYRPDRTDRRAWADKLREYFGNYLFDVSIPEREAIAAAATRHEPIPASDEQTTAVITELAKHLEDA